MIKPSQIFGVDTEWGYSGGQIGHESAFTPVIFCAVDMVAGSRIAFWERDPALGDFIQEHQGALFVAHNATAEMKYLLRLGMPLPERWYDTFVAERYRTNQSNMPLVSLSECLHRYNLPHLAPQVKEELRNRILNLEIDLTNPEERNEIREYCLSDCDGCLALYKVQTTP